MLCSTYMYMFTYIHTHMDWLALTYYVAVEKFHGKNKISILLFLCLLWWNYCTRPKPKNRSRPTDTHQFKTNSKDTHYRVAAPAAALTHTHILMENKHTTHTQTQKGGGGRGRRRGTKSTHNIIQHTTTTYNNNNKRHTPTYQIWHEEKERER